MSGLTVHSIARSGASSLGLCFDELEDLLELVRVAQTSLLLAPGVRRENLQSIESKLLRGAFFVQDEETWERWRSERAA